MPLTGEPESDIALRSSKPKLTNQQIQERATGPLGLIITMGQLVYYSESCLQASQRLSDRVIAAATMCRHSDG